MLQSHDIIVYIIDWATSLRNLILHLNVGIRHKVVYVHIKCVTFMLVEVRPHLNNVNMCVKVKYDTMRSVTLKCNVQQLGVK